MLEGDEVKTYISRVIRTIESIEPSQVGLLINTISETLDKGGKIFFAGNGGSASTANHMVNDIIMARNHRGLPCDAISLTDNHAIFSAIANDYSYEQVFSKQIETMGSKKDLIVFISASGNSLNLIEAFVAASKIGMKTSAIVGFDGGKLKSLVDIPIHAITEKGDYGPAEDFALVVNHAIATSIRSRI